MHLWVYPVNMMNSEYMTSTVATSYRQWVACVQQKDEFIKQRQQQNAKHQDGNETGDNSVSAEELAQFYKQFLDDNYELHRNYNRCVTVGRANNNNSNNEVTYYFTGMLSRVKAFMKATMGNSNHTGHGSDQML